MAMTYGPMSDGVSDSGGGRLIKVGMIAKLATGPDCFFLNVRASSGVRVSGALKCQESADSTILEGEGCRKMGKVNWMRYSRELQK